MGKADLIGFAHRRRRFTLAKPVTITVQRAVNSNNKGGFGLLKNKGKTRFGGLQGRIFSMSVMIVVMSIIAFAIPGLLQLASVRRLADITEYNHSKVIKEESQETMMKLTKQSLMETVDLSAKRIDGEFWTVRHDIMILANQVHAVLLHPENYEEREIFPPKKENRGQYVLQHFTSATAKTDEETLSVVKKTASLAPYMKKILNDEYCSTLDCFIAFPSGHTLVMDDMSDHKFDDNGNVKTYDPTERPWWKGAADAGGLFVSSREYSEVLGLSDVEFGMPVYVEGILEAVVEGSIRVERMRKIMSDITFGEHGFSIVIDKNGGLVCSSRNEGELSMEGDTAADLLHTDNIKLNELVETALTNKSGFYDITIDGEEYYAAFAPIETIGWKQLMFVSKTEFSKPSESMVKQVDKVTDEMRSSYLKSFNRAAVTALLFAGLLIATAVIAALSVSEKIAGPIRAMTGQIGRIKGDDFDIRMEDTYRTGDEIEVLAETFVEKCERTKGYIHQLVDITAKKERLSVEFGIAARIQRQMLPGNFPLYPEHREFDLCASMNPAKEVGGDFYDAFLIDDDRLCMVMADVSGKGVPAALFMVRSMILIKGRAMNDDGSGTPADILADVNTGLCVNNAQMMFVTVWLAILTLSTGELVYTNAGHEDPAVRRRGGEYALWETKHGLVVGAYPGSKYINQSERLEKGDTLFIYTDGIPEATNADDELFGIERMLGSLNLHKKEAPGALLQLVKKDIDDFVGEAPKFDDLTMLAVTYNGV